MDKTKEVLREIDIKAANSSNAYELIMELLKETYLEQKTVSCNDWFLSAGVTGKS